MPRRILAQCRQSILPFPALSGWTVGTWFPFRLFNSSQLPIQPEKQLSNKQFYYISEVLCMLLLVDLEVRILNSMYRLTSWSANPSSIPFLSGRFLFVKNFCLGLRLAFTSVWDTFCIGKTMTCDLLKKPADFSR